MLALQGLLLALLALCFWVGSQAPPETVEPRLALPEAKAVAAAWEGRVVQSDPGPEPLPPARYAGGWPEQPPRPRGALAYEALIRASAQRHGLDPELVRAVAAAESAFDPSALSPKGARGLMQVMPDTARRFGVDPEVLFEPRPNLEAGSRYLRWLSERYQGRLPLVLAAYNAGERAVESHGGIPPYPETREYLRRIYRILGRPTGELAAFEPGREETRSSAR